MPQHRASSGRPASGDRPLTVSGTFTLDLDPLAQRIAELTAQRLAEMARTAAGETSAHRPPGDPHREPDQG